MEAGSISNAYSAVGRFVGRTCDQAAEEMRGSSDSQVQEAADVVDEVGDFVEVSAETAGRETEALADFAAEAASTAASTAVRTISIPLNIARGFELAYNWFMRK
jgi:hypothetical protein